MRSVQFGGDVDAAVHFSRGGRKRDYAGSLSYISLDAFRWDGDELIDPVLRLVVDGTKDGAPVEMDLYLQFDGDAGFVSFMEGLEQAVRLERDPPEERDPRDDPSWVPPFECAHCRKSLAGEDDVAYVDPATQEPTEDEMNGIPLHIQCVVPYERRVYDLFVKFGLVPPHPDAD